MVFVPGDPGCGLSFDVSFSSTWPCWQRAGRARAVAPREVMSGSTPLLPFQPTEPVGGQLAAVSYLARHSGHTRNLYAT